MPLETTTTIDGLVASNPTGSDTTTEGNDHLQLIKNVMKIIFPGSTGNGLNAPITATEIEFNHIVGVTSSIQQQLDDISATGGGSVAAEAQIRANADTLIQNDVNQNEADSDAANVILQQNIVNETNTRNNNDIILQSNIDTEASTRSNADIALSNRIDTEVIDRTSADTILQNQINLLQAGSGAFPSGTRLLFSQAAAPLGWLQITTENDRMLRLVNTGGGGVGGTQSPVSFSVSLSHTHTTGSHVLTTAEMPSHNHIVRGVGNNSGGNTNSTFWQTDTSGNRDVTSLNTGNNSAHNHGNTGSTTPSQTITLKYQNIILASKT